MDLKDCSFTLLYMCIVILERLSRKSPASSCFFQNGNYVLKMRWLNASVEFICSVTSSSQSLDLNAPRMSGEPEPRPVRTLRHNRHRRDATDRLYYDPHSFYYNYACFLQYYMYMMSLAHASNTQSTTPAPQTTTAKPLGDDQQNAVYYPQFFPYYYLLGYKPVAFPPPSDCGSSASTGQSPQCSQNPRKKWPPSGPAYPGNSLPLQQILQQYSGGKPNDPTGQNTTSTTQSPTSPALTTVTQTPCPDQKRPIGANCLGAVSTYIPYENLTFPPHVSYGGPVDDQQNIPQQRYNLNVGLQPRARPHQWAGALPEHYRTWPGHWWYWYHHQPANVPEYSATSNWPWAKTGGY